jgi:hypothetical protein
MDFGFNEENAQYYEGDIRRLSPVFMNDPAPWIIHESRLLQRQGGSS